MIPRIAAAALRSGSNNSHYAPSLRYMSVITLSDDNAVKKFHAGNKKSILVRDKNKGGSSSLLNNDVARINHYRFLFFGTNYFVFFFLEKKSTSLPFGVHLVK